MHALFLRLLLLALFLTPVPVPATVVYRTECNPEHPVLYTIDDGWHAQIFDQMATALQEHGQHAILFLVGDAAYSLGAQRLTDWVSAGNSIAYHSMHHNELAELEKWDEAKWGTDYAKWKETLNSLLDPEALSGILPFARAPYGLFNKAFLGMAEKNNLIPLGWSADPGTLARKFPLQCGDIFLLHVRSADLPVLDQLLDIAPESLL